MSGLLGWLPRIILLRIKQKTSPVKPFLHAHAYPSGVLWLFSCPSWSSLKKAHLTTSQQRCSLLMLHRWGFPDSSVGKESTCNARDPSSILGLERSTGEGIGYPLQYSWASFGLSWSRICLQCRRPGFEPWVGKIPWRRERLPTPVFQPGICHGLYSPWGQLHRVGHDWAACTAQVTAT